jgi:DNA segregation ATPase FtsK/SpoIIIE, S-DNA-T family
MRLTVELLDGTGVGRPAVIDADDDVTVGAVATELAAGLRLYDMASPSLHVLGRPAQKLAPNAHLALADIRSGDRVEIVEGDHTTSLSEEGAATIVIEAGPQTGRRIELRPGRNYMGRGGRSSVVINDELLSRVHLSVTVSDVVVVSDEGSTNGISVDGTVVTQPLTLKSGQRVSAGATVFRVEQHVGALASAAKGTVPFNRPPRVWKPFRGPEVEVPVPPGPKPKQRIPMVSAAAPLAMGGVMYAMTRNPQTMLFSLMSPVMMMGSVYESRRGGAKDHAEQVAQFRTELQQTDARLKDLEAQERASRETEAPGVGDLAQVVEQTSARLWERSETDEDFLDIRLGVGERPLRTTLKFTPQKNSMPDLVAEANELLRTYTELRSAPIVVKLDEVGTLGLAGAQTETSSVARSVILQLAALHSPADLVITALLGDSMQQEWEWLMWLPHVRSAASPIVANHLPPTSQAALEFLDELAQIVDKRRGTNSFGSAVAQHPAIVVVIDESIELERSRLSWLFSIDPSLRVSIVWLGSSVSRLPKGCGAVAEIHGGAVPGTVGWTKSGERVETVRFEGVPGDHAARVARGLTPIVDVTAGSSGGTAIPQRVMLVDVLGSREVLRSKDPVLENWTKSKKTLRAPVGMTGTGPFTLDMRTDGPHALVAGTTGAGKSEFLQALISSLAVNHPPSRVTFLLVDYKGGAAFAKCVEFPHTVGLVTDLDTNQVRRALVSLNAELHYRERILQEHRCKDLMEMEDKNTPGTPPSLLIIVDEFAALAKEIPEFVDGVVNVAQRGRSLGLHLVLATQRPGGVISDNIRANTNLRIALRVADPNESNDVIGTPAAAALSRTTPGRGVAKVGPQELLMFQSGYVGGHTSVERTNAAVSIADLAYGTTKAWPSREKVSKADNTAPNDLARLVDVVQASFHESGLDLPRRPWLAPLPIDQDLYNLPRSQSDSEIVIGLQDDPAHQAQRPARWSVEKDGSIAIFGSSGSGKSTALWTIAASISSALGDTPPHVYAIDFAGRALDAIEDLPSVGSVIASDDHERITRLLLHLRQTITERASLFADVNAGTLSDYRRLARNGAAANTARIFVLIDGFGNFLSTYERIERGIWTEMVPKLMAEGRQYGVHFVVTTDRRNSMPNSVYSIIPQRIVLRMSNDDEYGSVGAPFRVLTNDSPSGRAFYDGLELQIGVPGGSLRSDEQALALTKLGAQLHRQKGGFKAPPIRVLETEVSRTALGSLVRGSFARSGATLNPVSFASNEGVFVVAGPMKSGKSSTLASLAEALAEQTPGRPMFFVSPRRSPLSTAPFWTAASTNPEDAATLIRQLADDIAKIEPEHAPAVFIDDFHECHESDVGQAVSALVKVAREYPVLIVASAESSIARRASQYTPLGELRQFKTGIVLAPDVVNGDGDILSAAIPNTSVRVWPPGRGYLVGRGSAELIQVGLPS